MTPENPEPLVSETKTPSVAETRTLHFTTRVLPWLLGILMLGVYAVTLDPWVSAGNLRLVAALEGLTWEPNLLAPVTFLLTLPLGWLPGAWIPLALNLGTAACAAASLGLLARSVALLPHDPAKTRPPARHGFIPPDLMASRSAWLPPLLAVLVCGLQLSFWQNAVSATGQMINLLMFAYVIRCFLEYNASGEDSWLPRAALVHGLAAANDWAMAAFIPVFLAGVIGVMGLFGRGKRKLEKMLRRRDARRLSFWWKLPAGWLAGFSLILLPPILAGLSVTAPMDFWPAVKFTLRGYESAFRHLSRPFLITSGLICVLPVFLMGLRYYHFLTGRNRLQLYIGTAFFQLICAFCLLVNLWILFDTPLSPHRLAPGVPSLPLYFLGALSIGYFAGHFLLATAISEAPSSRQRRRSSSRERRRQTRLLWLRLFNRVTLATGILLALGVPTALIVKNRPDIARVRANPWVTCVQQAVAELPPEGAVLLGQDTFQMEFLQAALIRAGRQDHYLLVNPGALIDAPSYAAFLRRQKHPGLALGFPEPEPADPARRLVAAVKCLRDLSASHALYCLPTAPLDSLEAEFFYFQPAGLLDRVIPYPGQEAFAPPLPPQVTRTNEIFWAEFRARQLAGLVREINPPARQPASGLWKKIMNTVRFWPAPDADSVIAGFYYSRALNDWGVELQKAGRFADAGQCFAEALQLNAQNVPAQMNQEFNADYQAHREVVLQKPLDTARSLNKYRDWRHVQEEGAVDEPNFCFMFGAILADKQLFRPAIAQFERVKQLSPGSLDARASLARVFLESQDFTNALMTASEILALDPTNQVGLLLKAGGQVALGDYREAISLLNQVLDNDPTNNRALLDRATAYRGLHELPEARRDYTALRQVTPTFFPVYYYLARLDEAESNAASAITNYELFLQKAPPNVKEVATAQARLAELKFPPPSTNSVPWAPAN